MDSGLSFKIMFCLLLNCLSCRSISLPLKGNCTAFEMDRSPSLVSMVTWPVPGERMWRDIVVTTLLQDAVCMWWSVIKSRVCGCAFLTKSVTGFGVLFLPWWLTLPTHDGCLDGHLLQWFNETGSILARKLILDASLAKIWKMGVSFQGRWKPGENRGKKVRCLEHS